jgi:hopanoid biosynthesis associated radical SAM protein HpnH
MGFAPQLMVHLAQYLVGQRVAGQRRFPLVLMLEPTHRCNLACAGCGRILEHRETMAATLSAEECLASAAEADSPVVAVSGGEPLLHPQVERIVAGLIAQGRFVYLCTNGTLVTESLHKFEPSAHFAFNVHVDGLAATHDRLVGRAGTFDKAMGAIDAATQAGFQVCTNTTLYRDTDPDEVVRLLRHLTRRGVDGVLVSPGFQYEEVADDIFLGREEIHRSFRTVFAGADGTRFYNTPHYLAFLAGREELSCSPWGNPTRTPQGWKQPCYLLTDGYCRSFRELMDETDWERYGPGRDARCANCMVHSGFEASAVQAMLSPRGLSEAAAHWLAARTGRLS